MASEHGEHVDVRMGDKSISLGTRDLLPILLLIGAVLSGYLVWLSLDRSMQEHARRQQIQIEQHVLQDKQLIEQTEQIRRMLVILDFNVGRQRKDKLPLDVGIPPSKRKQFLGEETAATDAEE